MDKFDNKNLGTLFACTYLLPTKSLRKTGANTDLSSLSDRGSQLSRFGVILKSFYLTSGRPTFDVVYLRFGGLTEMSIQAIVNVITLALNPRTIIATYVTQGDTRFSMEVIQGKLNIKIVEQQ